MDRSFKYPSHIQEIPQIREDLVFLKKEWSITASESRQILVMIEEIFSNIVRYAFADTIQHQVEIKLNLNENQVVIEIIDDGIPFNPLDYQIAPVSDPTTSNAGGMGLTLIRTFSNQMEYQRSAGKNHLKITKKVKSK